MTLIIHTPNITIQQHQKKKRGKQKKNYRESFHNKKIHELIPQQQKEKGERIKKKTHINVRN
jgi:hypothetical protein